MDLRKSSGLKITNRVIFIILSSIIISLVVIKLTAIPDFEQLNNYWFVIPITLSILFIQGIKFSKYSIPNRYFLSILLASTFLCSTIFMKCTSIYVLIIECEELIWIVLIVIAIILRLTFLIEIDEKDNDDGNDEKKLFNLFYVNTSKMHEIAMLIDNTIMKTVEKNQTSESLLKNEHKFNFGIWNKGSIDHVRSSENSFKKDVYESFDVKTTKSILLDRIYSTLPKCEVVKLDNVGQVILFNNINLVQTNTDDTVFALNVLKDSNMKNQSDDGNVEVNLSGMMDEMLEDFTIDYTFSKDDLDFLIRIPFKSKEFFENNYSHNDLQLGSLSVIGIYRGDINFNEINSISTKFLQAFSESYNNELNKGERMTDYSLSHSSNDSNASTAMTFDIQGNKELGNKHLIDLIAIIQEIQIEKEELINE